MMRVCRGEVELALPRRLYPRESLQAAALAVSGRCEVYLEQKGPKWLVTLRGAEKSDAAALRRAAGEFLNEALSHAYRQSVVRFHGPLTSPVLGRLIETAFPAPRPDPLEELEPQVGRDRLAETQALLAAAQKMEGA